MMIPRRSWMLAIPVLLAACGDAAEVEDAPEVDTDAVVAPVDAEGTAGMQGAPATGAAAPAGPQVSVAMTAAGGSGVTGEATLTEPSPGQTQVMIHLNKLEPNSSHAGHIHTGTCASLGPAVVPLPEATADASGMAMVNGTVSRPLSEVANGSHLIAYHQNPGEDHGPTIVCGEIPAGTV